MTIREWLIDLSENYIAVMEDGQITLKPIEEDD